MNFSRNSHVQHSDFELIQKRLAPEEPLGRLSEGTVTLNGNKLSTNCDCICATMIFKSPFRTFIIGKGLFIMGWCDQSNPYHNILIDFKFGRYYENGYWHKGSFELENSNKLCVKEGDEITFDYDRVNGLILIINNVPNVLDINLDGFESCFTQTWNVYCNMLNGSIIYK